MSRYRGQAFLIAFASLFADRTISLADTAQVTAGVRAFVYKHVEAQIPISYDSEGISYDLAVKEILGTSVIRSISPEVVSAYQQLHQVDSKLAESIDLGKIDLTPSIDVQADAVGLAWGLSDRVMIAAGLPVMKASVTLEGGYYNSGAVANAARQLRTISNPETRAKALAFAQVLEQLPEIRGGHLQGILVDHYGYKPVGNWQGSGIGDARLFLHMKLYKGDIYKNAFRVGAEIPTGRQDDPDNLLDIPFGSGYYKTYVETQQDIQLWKDDLVLNLNGRYQYHWDADRVFRLKPSRSFPLTRNKELIHFKPGNSWILGAELSAKLTRSISVSAGLSRKTTSQDSIRGQRTDYDYGILEDGTESQADNLEAGITYSSVNSFLLKEFPVPFKIGASISRVFAGRNTEQVHQTQLNFELYF
jgi:hypothetical protein